MNIMKAQLLYIILLLSCKASAHSDNTLRLTLQNVIQMAREQSIASKQAFTIKQTRYWEYLTYKSNYRPQLSLEGNLPGYNKTFIEVQQPDGTIQFQSVRNNNSALSLSFSQTVVATGGTVFGTTQLQRFDDFDRNTTLYNGVPFGVGFSQPLFRFNNLKWEQNIQPLKFKESGQAFIESMEEIAIRANAYFFDLLLSQVNFQIARTNLDNTDKILTIAKEKFELGKLSRNEILQLKLEQLKAQKAVGIARRDMEIATLNLRSYIGMRDTEINLDPPAATINMQVQTDKVLSEAFENRSDAIAFVRRIAEAKRDVSKAVGDNGLNAELTAQIGFSKTARTIPKVYQSPKDQQQIQLTFTIPILDWGRSRSRAKTAEANLQFTEYAVEQDKLVFTQEIITQITLFELMKQQLLLTREADSIASEKYQIAKDRYVLGNLSITDLSIAFQENDQAKRDYIFALRDFWGAYFQIRFLSLYDFERNEKIRYD
jgi:outer membrane protein